MFFSLEQRDFWNMIFYRALFEEKDFDLAGKIITYLENNLKPIIEDLPSLYKESETLRNQIYSFDENVHDSFTIEDSFIIHQMIINISSDGRISYRLKSLDGEIKESRINNECWNDSQIIEIYHDIFTTIEPKKFGFNLIDFGKILYLLLPKLIRKFFSQFKPIDQNIIPQIYFIVDPITIPFGFLFDNNFFCLKYSIGYNCREFTLGGVPFEEKVQSKTEKYNTLVIDTINSTGPLRWNEEKHHKELIFPFEAGLDEINYIINYFKSRDEINDLKILMEIESTRENILKYISQNSYHLIHFVGNIFYSRGNPNDSYFLTNDNQIIKLAEISKILNQNKSLIRPLLFFDCQIYDVYGKKVENALRSLGKIIRQFNFEHISGVLARNDPIFSTETKFIIANLYLNIFNKNTLGESVLNARQQLISKLSINIGNQQIKRLNEDEFIKKINLENFKAINSYILFAKPWKKL